MPYITGDDIKAKIKERIDQQCWPDIIEYIGGGDKSWIKIPQPVPPGGTPQPGEKEQALYPMMSAIADAVDTALQELNVGANPDIEARLEALELKVNEIVGVLNRWHYAVVQSVTWEDFRLLFPPKPNLQPIVGKLERGGS